MKRSSITSATSGKTRRRRGKVTAARFSSLVLSLVLSLVPSLGRGFNAALVASLFVTGTPGTSPAHAQDIAPAKQSLVDAMIDLAVAENPYAQYRLGRLYYTGDGVARDPLQAFEWYVRAAEKGLSTAQNEIGVMYNRGEGTPRDDVLAAQWYRRAADQGLTVAARNLAVLYDRGEGVAQDRAQALHWYLKAAERDDPALHNRIGALYDAGDGIASDPREAATWYQRAADRKLPAAIRNLGRLHEFGRGVAQDKTKARTLYRTAADGGDGPAARLLGSLYQRGQGTKRDLKQAFLWIDRAAKAGDRAAMRDLASLYYRGDGTAQNYDTALDWFRRASEWGDAAAASDIAALFPPPAPRAVAVAEIPATLKPAASGPATSAPLKTTAAVKSSPTSVAMDIIEDDPPHFLITPQIRPKPEEVPLQANAGPVPGKLEVTFAPEAGVAVRPAATINASAEIGTAANIDAATGIDAVALPIIAAVQPGMPAVSASVAAAAAFSPAGVALNEPAPAEVRAAATPKTAKPKSEDHAVTELLNAARSGDAEAQVDLGRRYEIGDHITRDLGQAALWYGRAAEQGNAFAQSSLGYLYIKGDGVPKDPVQAHKWFSLSAAQNYATAADARDAIEHDMIPADLESAQCLAASWIERHGASAVHSHGFNAPVKEPLAPSVVAAPSTLQSDALEAASKDIPAPRDDSNESARAQTNDTETKTE